jgi:hypothetical protein
MHCRFCKPSRAMPDWKNNHGRIWSSESPPPAMTSNPLWLPSYPEMALNAVMGIAEIF